MTQLTETQTQAEVKYLAKGGWYLIIPKYGNAPMLFLEWFTKFRAGKNWLHKVNETPNDGFYIKLNMPKEDFQSAADYINANL
jgi:hypothetical protein